MAEILQIRLFLPDFTHIFFLLHSMCLFFPPENTGHTPDSLGNAKGNQRRKGKSGNDQKGVHQAKILPQSLPDLGKKKGKAVRLLLV